MTEAEALNIARKLSDRKFVREIESFLLDFAREIRNITIVEIISNMEQTAQEANRDATYQGDDVPTIVHIRNMFDAMSDPNQL